MKGLLFFLLPVSLVLGPSAASQTLITSDSTVSSVFGYPTMSISEVDMAGSCLTSYLDDQQLVVEFPYDINILQIGEMFGLGTVYVPSPPPVKFFHLSIGAGIGPDITYQTEDLLLRGLACDEANHSIAAGKGITMYDYSIFQDYPHRYLGDLPPDMHCLGDITYRKGRFYMSAVGNKLVEVDMKDPSKSEVVMYFPPGTLPIHGLTTVQVGCDSAVTYAVGRAEGYSKIYELDFDDWSLTEVCQIDRVVTGAGTLTECALPPCALSVDLDADNSSIAFRGNYCAMPFCQPPVAVCDTDVAVLSDSGTLDSLSLELVGTLDGAAEHLSTNLPPGGLAVTGDGTPSIRFYNIGTATTADFEAALLSVSYHNTAPAFTYGTRQVRATGWAGGVASLLSVADLPLSDKVVELSATLSVPSCPGLPDGSLAVQPGGGLAPYAYQWEGGGADSLLAGLVAGSYPVTVTDANGCVRSDTFLLPDPPLLSATVENTGFPTVCGAFGKLTATATGGTGPYAYAWASGATGGTLGNALPGLHAVTVTDANGCTATASYLLPAGSADTSLVQATVCAGGQYAWNGAVFVSDTLACQSFQLPNGCDTVSCLSLEVLAPPQLSVDGSLCGGTAVVLSVTGPYSAYGWSQGGSGSAVTVATAGSYGVTVTGPGGCTATATAEVQPGLSFSLASLPPTCHGLSDGAVTANVQPGGAGPYQYSLGGGAFGPGNSFGGLPGGTYLVAVRDVNGCEAELAVQLPDPPAVLLDAGPDATARLGEPVTLSAVTNIAGPSVQWQPEDFLECPGCLSTTALPLHSLVYTVAVTDGNGCTASDQVSVTVEQRRNLYFPNAFSPDGDGINDRFTLFSDASVSVIAKLEVFDRWGGLVFRGSGLLPGDTAAGWDGTAHGSPLPGGTYAFLASVVRVDGSVERVEGAVNLLR